jgi:aminoglycoside 3-N-acetyltransferase
LGEETPESLQRGMALRLQCEERQLLDFGRLAPGVALDAALAKVRACSRRHTGRLLKAVRALPAPAAAREETSPYQAIAAEITPSRAVWGFPHDLRRVPKADRHPLPDRTFYGPFSRVLANMDGRRTLGDLLLDAAWESGTKLSPGQVRSYVGAVEYLSEHGYLKTQYRRVIAKSEIVAALRAVGVQSGDLLFVHAGLSHLGHIEGGADTILDALLEALGPQGTLLLPSFTFSAVSYTGEHAHNRTFHPFHPVRSSCWVGRVARSFLRRPGVRRSAHPTHSVAAYGPLADACLRDHAETDSPTGPSSPLGKLLDGNGKMLWFGAGLASTTFFHFLEDAMDLPYLENAVCLIEKDDGRLRSVMVPKHLPGHRDFYRNPGEETKMYRRLLQDGLTLSRVPLGFGALKLVEARQMYDLGVRALTADPTLMLCDSPECFFCSHAKELVGEGMREGERKS